MKKFGIAFVMGVVALALFATGAAFAQTAQPPTPGSGLGMGPSTGSGPLHDYMANAMAKVLGITADQFESRRAAGETAYEIALSQNLPAEKIPALISQGRAAALEAAVADGVITQAQADWMKTRGHGMGLGNCDGTGAQSGSRMMTRGGRWGQTNP